MNNILRYYLKNKIQNNQELMDAFNNIYKDSGGILWFRGLAKENLIIVIVIKIHLKN